MLSIFSWALLAICLSALEIGRFRSSAHFSVGLFVLFLWCMSNLYILEINPYQLHCLQVFSLSPYVVISFVAKSYLIWLGHICLFLLLFLLLWEMNLRKHWYNLCQRMFCLWSLLGVLGCHVLNLSLNCFECIFVYGVWVCSDFIDLHLAVQLFQHHLQSVAGGDGGINKRILIAYICQQIVYYEEMMIITMNGNSFKILEAGEGRKEELLVFCYESKLVFTVYMYYLLLHWSQPYRGEGACVTQWSYEPCCCRAIQDGRVIVESSEKMWSTDGENGKSLQYSSHKQYEKAKRYDTWRWATQIRKCPICY